MIRDVFHVRKMTCQQCQMDWALDEFSGFTPYEQSQFKDGIGCPNCVYFVQVIVCLNGSVSDSGTWQRVEVIIGKDVHLGYVEAEAETAVLAMMEELGQSVRVVLSDGIISGNGIEGGY